MSVDERVGKNARYSEPEGGNYVELNTFLKVHGFGDTGGQAKGLIRGGSVMVNGNLETRNKRKLVSGDKVNIGDKTFIVKDDVLKKKAGP